MMFLKGSGYLGPIAISLCREWAWSCWEGEEEEEESRQEMKRGRRTPNISDSGRRGGRKLIRRGLHTNYAFHAQ